MEFVRGAKLNSLPPAEIRALVKVGMDVFLAQLLVIGFMHSDPHPGQPAQGGWSLPACLLCTCFHMLKRWSVPLATNLLAPLRHSSCACRAASECSGMHAV